MKKITIEQLDTKLNGDANTDLRENGRSENKEAPIEESKQYPPVQPMFEDDPSPLEEVKEIEDEEDFVDQEPHKQTK